jgi:NADH-quinone oxidoreductase subunit L
LSNFETFWSNFLDNLARTKVVLAHIIAWADKTFVDGFIHFLLFLGRNLGNLFRNLQGRNIQAYFSFVIFFLLLGLLACLFF